jgi:hypothetical protein
MQGDYGAIALRHNLVGLGEVAGGHGKPRLEPAWTSADETDHFQEADHLMLEVDVRQRAIERFGIGSAKTTGHPCAELLQERIRVAATAVQLQGEIELFLTHPSEEGSQHRGVLAGELIVRPDPAYRGMTTTRSTGEGRPSRSSAWIGVPRRTISAVG